MMYHCIGRARAARHKLLRDCTVCTIAAVGVAGLVYSFI